MAMLVYRSVCSPPVPFHVFRTTGASGDLRFGISSCQLHGCRTVEMAGMWVGWFIALPDLLIIELALDF